MPTKEKRLLPPRFSGAEKKRLLGEVRGAARDLTILLEGLSTELYTHIATLCARIEHNGKAHNEEGVTLDDISGEVAALLAYVESVRNGSHELFLMPTNETRH
jgi:hypothetical protein